MPSWGDRREASRAERGSTTGGGTGERGRPRGVRVDPERGRKSDRLQRERPRERRGGRRGMRDVPTGTWAEAQIGFVVPGWRSGFTSASSTGIEPAAQRRPRRSRGPSSRVALPMTARKRGRLRARSSRSMRAGRAARPRSSVRVARFGCSPSPLAAAERGLSRARRQWMRCDRVRDQERRLRERRPGEDLRQLSEVCCCLAAGRARSGAPPATVRTAPRPNAISAPSWGQTDPL